MRPFVMRTLQAFYKHDSPEIIQQPVTMPSARPQMSDRGPRVSVIFLTINLLCTVSVYTAPFHMKR